MPKKAGENAHDDKEHDKRKEFNDKLHSDVYIDF